MAKKQQTKTALSLRDAADALRSIQNGLDEVLSAAEDVLPSLGQELSQLMGRSLSVLAHEGRQGLEIARHEVTLGAAMLERLMADVERMWGEGIGPVEVVVKKEVKKVTHRRRAPRRSRKAMVIVAKKKDDVVPSEKPKQARLKKAAQPSVGDALAAVMGKAKGPLKAAELASILKKDGYRSASKNFSRVIQTTLSADRRFRRDPAGGYRLA